MLPLRWFDNRATGDSMTRILEDVNSVERMLARRGDLLSAGRPLDSCQPIGHRRRVSSCEAAAAQY